MAVLVGTVGLALVFAFTNGFHDSANAIAALVATRAASPAAAVALASVGNVLGPLVVGTAVADTVAGMVDVSAAQVPVVVGAALTGAVVWNLLTWWLGLPSSSSHALVGGLAGAAAVEAGGGAVRWGGFTGIHPVGVLGVLGILATSPVLGFAAGVGGLRVARRVLRRATREVQRPVRRAQWLTAGALAFSHGANDAQKTTGVVALLVVAHEHRSRFDVPLWATLAAAAALTLGTSVGGWRIVRTVGSGIYRIRPLDGLVSEAGSATVILGSALVGGPVSTTHVVASSVVGVGAGQRWRHVRWGVVREMGLAWLVTLPASAAVAAVAVFGWRLFA